MDRITLRLPPDLTRRFDAAAAGQGGRSRLLRRLMEAAAEAPVPAGPPPGSAAGPAKLTLRLAPADLVALEAAAAATGLSRTQWTVALIRRRLHGRPQFSRPDAAAFLEVQRELRRIGVNISQIARALNTAVLQGAAPDPELAQLAVFQGAIRASVDGLRDAFEGNLAYWAVEP